MPYQFNFDIAIFDHVPFSCLDQLVRIILFNYFYIYVSYYFTYIIELLCIELNSTECIQLYAILYIYSPRKRKINPYSFLNVLVRARAQASAYTYRA